MAGQISHIIAGEDALKRASGKTTGAAASELEVLSEAAPWFRFGCQGPDIFYHNQRTMPSGLHYGSLAHRRGYDDIVAGFSQAMSEEERRPDSPEGAYLLGMATHAALDRATHPFIVYFSGWAKPGDSESQRLRGCHPFLERILDILLLRRSRGIEVSAFDIAALMKPPSAIEAAEGAAAAEGAGAAEGRIAALWAAALRAAYPRATAQDELLEKRAANALIDARYFYDVTNPASENTRRLKAAYLDDDPGRRRVALLYPRRVPEDLDAANEGHALWEDPSGEGSESSSSYFELVEEGRIEAARAIAALLEAWQTGDGSRIAMIVGQGGLSVRDREGNPLRPKLSRPLSLPQIMEAEYRRRIAEG